MGDGMFSDRMMEKMRENEETRMRVENLGSPVGETIFNRIQREMTAWQQHNFPGREAWIPLMGLGEELGELTEACDVTAVAGLEEIKDAIGDCLIYMSDYCNGMGYSMQAIYSSLPTIDFRRDVIINYGKLCHTHIKQVQRIRMHEPHRENAIIAMRNIMAYLSDINSEFLSKGERKTIEQIAWDIWLKVRQRDWQKNANKAHEKVKE